MKHDPSAVATRLEPGEAPSWLEDRATDDACWDPALARALYELLNDVGLGDAALEDALERLEAIHGAPVYAELIYMLSHLRFDAATARVHWTSVVEHQRHMAERLGVPVDVRVALVSYFLEVQRRFRNPKLIEMRVFEQTRASAYWDELTGLRNYRFFSEHLQQEVLRSEVSSLPLSLVMIDVDDFKSFNDSFGHEAGNRALAAVAGVLPVALRPADVAARYGGEEFALVLAGTAKHEARKIAERIRQAVAALPPAEGTRPLTVSLGIATHPADAREAGDLVCHADRALYAAKYGGKNQVRLYRESTRSYVRVEAALRGRFAAQSLEWMPMTTVKVSQGGLQFSCPAALPVRSLLDFRIELPDSVTPVAAVGRVVRVDARPDGLHSVAVQFVDVPLDDRSRLRAHLDRFEAVPHGSAMERGESD